MLNLFDQKEMKDVFSELESYENRLRKNKAFKQLDIYSGNQAKYIMYKIEQMYGKDACEHIQAITDINLARRISDAEASIYKEEPERYYTDATDAMVEQIAQHYESMKINEKLLLANSLYRLGNQCQLMLYPSKGKLKSRVLYQHQYDVVPMGNDPEAPEVYIIPLNAKETDRNDFFNNSDNINQRIADKNDADLARNRYMIWTKDYHFKCNGLGQIIDPVTDKVKYELSDEDIVNPIGRLPIIDVSRIKTMGFFAGGSEELANFSVTFGVILSDLGEIVKLQGYSQGVLSSLEEPKSLSIGPHRALWLKKDKNEPGDKDPSFQFVSPSPDLMGSMNYAENILRMFLTSRGTDSKLVTTQGTKEFASGFERLLSMVDRAEATKSDKHLFRDIERQKFEITRAWNNYLHSTTDGLDDENKIAVVGDNVIETVKFYEPQQIMTQQDKEASIEKRLDLQLLSRKQAVMELYEVEEDKALEMIGEIDGDQLNVTDRQ